MMRQVRKMWRRADDKGWDFQWIMTSFFKLWHFIYESTVPLNGMIFYCTTPSLHFFSNENSGTRKGLWQGNEQRQSCWCFRGILIIVFLYAWAPWSLLSDSRCWVSHSRVLRFSFVSFPAVHCCLSAVICRMSSLYISFHNEKMSPHRPSGHKPRTSAFFQESFFFTISDV